MLKIFKILVPTLLVMPLFTWAQSNQAVDWTPFFKSWENACESGKDEIKLQNNLIKSNNYKNSLGNVVLPSKNLKDTGKPIVKRNQDPDGTNITFSVFVPIKNGTYYGVKLKGYEQVVGEENGIGMSMIIFNEPASVVNKKLKKVKYKKKSDEFMGDIQASLMHYNSQYVLMCDTSM